MAKCVVYLDTEMKVRSCLVMHSSQATCRPTSFSPMLFSRGRKQAPGLLKYLHKAATLLDLFAVNIAFPGLGVSFVDQACQTWHRQRKGRGIIPPVTVEQMERENTLAGGGGVRRGELENVESKTPVPEKQSQKAAQCESLEWNKSASPVPDVQQTLETSVHTKHDAATCQYNLLFLLQFLEVPFKLFLKDLIFRVFLFLKFQLMTLFFITKLSFPFLSLLSASRKLLP